MFDFRFWIFDFDAAVRRGVHRAGPEPAGASWRGGDTAPYLSYRFRYFRLWQRKFSVANGIGIA
jgi:hypothetical protein